MTLEEFFYSYGKVQVLYGNLEEDSQRQLIVSLKKNPIALLIKHPPYSVKDIPNYYQFDDYFLYQPTKKCTQLNFIRKDVVIQLEANVRTLVKNEWITFKWKLN